MKNINEFARNSSKIYFLENQDNKSGNDIMFKCLTHNSDNNIMFKRLT